MRVGHELLLLTRLRLIPCDVICLLDGLGLVVGHGLECVDKVHELQATIDIFVKTSNPIHDICVLKFCRAIKL